ncbi:MAG TPA: glycosyl hydrolase [Tepidisphaeraceae bacterium]|jgi:xylan 1,4-beta-xylosidase|nr:glycosyl hydrolase [Tepidisphaeraceae bacterium]
MSGSEVLEFRCDIAESAGPLAHFWEHAIGSGHAQLALRADWQQQLARCHREIGVEHVRFHGILCDAMGTLICNDDKLLYSFYNADLICDFLLSIGMRPFIELSFMPETLASGSKTVFHYRANVTPPKDYAQWGTLVEKLAEHWVERYGAAEVRSWFFEVWNEPNLKAFWPASQAEYFKLYQTTSAALKKVDSHLQVGGPATARDGWIDEFLEYSQKKHLPVDFVSTHHYPTDALGTQNEDTETQLAESQRSILRQWAQDTRRKVGNRPLYYTEWNISSNPRDPLHDEPYAAAAIVKAMMEAAGLVQGYSFWTFSDIFSENYFPSRAFQGGFGLLTIEGIAKPAYHAFQLLHRLGDRRLVVDGIHSTVDCWAVRRNDDVTLLLTNFALPRHPIQTERARLILSADRPPTHATIERIDQEHGNARRAWSDMGSPEYLSAWQVGELHEASEISAEPIAVFTDQGRTSVEVELEPQSVAAITLKYPAASPAGRQP